MFFHLIMVDHGTLLKAVNHPIRKAMLKIVNDASKISRADLISKLMEDEVLDKEELFDYNMNYLLQVECIKKLDTEEYEILPPGKVIEKY